MNYKAVLFDLDGTLLDSLEDLADSMNRVLGVMGFPGHPLASYRHFVGDGVEMLVRRSLPQQETAEALVQDGVALMRQEYGRNWAAKTRPYEGIVEMLAGLRDLGGVLAVLSNKPHTMTVKVVEHFFPLQPFAEVWGARPEFPKKPHTMTVKVVEHFFPLQPFAEVWGARPEFPKKPSPAAALELARKLDILPQHFLYLGDTDTDMRTATAAGMRAIGAAWGFRTVEELTGSGAETVVQHPRELLDLFAAEAPGQGREEGNGSGQNS